MKPFIHHLLRQEMAVYFENDKQLEDLFQNLTVMRFYVRDGKKDEAYELIRQLQENVQQCQVKNYTRAFHLFGLEMAIGELVLTYKKNDVPVYFHQEGEPIFLPRDQTYALYQITEEALDNARQHADASVIYVSLEMKPTRVKLFISDDGRGFSLPDVRKAKPETFGLTKVRELGKMIGASVRVKTSPESGTRLYVNLKGNFQNRNFQNP